MLGYEAQAMKTAQLNLIAPLQYGAMPDLGRYSMPDGPIPNWSELLPLGKIDEARDAQVEAIEHAVERHGVRRRGHVGGRRRRHRLRHRRRRRRRRLPRRP